MQVALLSQNHKKGGTEKSLSWSSSPTEGTQFWQQTETSKEVFNISECTQVFSPDVSWVQVMLYVYCTLKFELSYWI